MFEIVNENKNLLIDGDSISGMNLIKALRVYDFILIDDFYDDKINNSVSEFEKKVILAKELLNDKGVIAVNFREKDCIELRLILDKIFGESNYRDTYIINNINENKPSNLRDFDLFMVYSKTNKYKKLDKKLNLNSIDSSKCWKLFTENFEKINNNRIGVTNNNIESLITSIEDTSMINWLMNEVYEKKLYGLESVKSLKNVMNIVDICTDKDSKVLNVFTHSGITGQAVLELNKKDGGNRVITLITNSESSTCRGLYYPEIKEICKIYKQQLIYMKLK